MGTPSALGHPAVDPALPRQAPDASAAPTIVPILNADKRVGPRGFIARPILRTRFCGGRCPRHRIRSMREVSPPRAQSARRRALRRPADGDRDAACAGRHLGQAVRGPEYDADARRDPQDCTCAERCAIARLRLRLSARRTVRSHVDDRPVLRGCDVTRRPRGHERARELGVLVGARGSSSASRSSWAFAVSSSVAGSSGKPGVRLLSIGGFCVGAERALRMACIARRR